MLFVSNVKIVDNISGQIKQNISTKPESESCKEPFREDSRIYQSKNHHLSFHHFSAHLQIALKTATFCFTEEQDWWPST